MGVPEAGEEEDASVQEGMGAPVASTDGGSATTTLEMQSNAAAALGNLAESDRGVSWK